MRECLRSILEAILQMRISMFYLETDKTRKKQMLQYVKTDRVILLNCWFINTFDIIITVLLFFHVFRKRLNTS